MRSPLKDTRIRLRRRPRLELLEDRTAPAVIVVNSLDDGAPTMDGNLTLREAIQAANTNTAVGDAPAGESTPDTIVFASSLTGGTINLDPGQGQLILSGGGDLSIIGPGGVSSGVTVSGQGNIRVFNMIPSAAQLVTLMNLTVADGNPGAANNGGAIFNAGMDTTLTNVVVTRSQVPMLGLGGGIYNNGSLTLNNTTVSGNKGYRGGGIYNQGELTINTGSRIVSNVAENSGGGIYNDSGQATITETTIAGNTAVGFSGGGIDNEKTPLTIRRSTFSDNQAGSQGGGLFNFESNTNIANSTFAGNLAREDGGGIFQIGPANTVTIVNSTIARNSANGLASTPATTGFGGGIDLFNGTLNLNNSILSLNLAGQTGSDNLGNVFGTFNNNFSLLGGTPLLSPLQDNGGPTFTLAPLLYDPNVIGQGNNTLATDPASGAPLATDQRGTGFPRIVGINVDLGAVEFFSPSATTTLAVTQDGMDVTSISTARTVTLMADVSSGTTGVTPSGSVNFYDDPTPNDPTDSPTLLNALPVPLDDMGMASLPNLPLSAGPHNLFARFTPSSAAFDPSASPAQMVTARITDTVGVFDPLGVVFQLLNQNTTTSTGPDFGYSFGFTGAQPVVGNWTGATSAVSFPGVVTPSGGLLRWELSDDNPPVLPNLAPFDFGSAGQVALAGDWNGDGTTGIGVFDPSTATFSLRNSPSAGAPDFTFTFGASGFLPVAGDWNGDGTDTVGVYDPASGMWFLAGSNTNSVTPELFSPALLLGGQTGARPVAGNWDGMGGDGIGVFFPQLGSNAGFGGFLLRNEANAGAADVNGGDVVLAGLSTWLPLAGNWGLAPTKTNELLAPPTMMPLTAAVGVGPHGEDVGDGELQSAVSAALQRLESSGAAPQLVNALAGAQFTVGQLPGSLLAVTDVAGNRVIVDADGAGQGWYVDPTPGADGDAIAGYDLLTAVLHEMGHLAGHGHDDSGLMAESLPPGVRHADALDAVFASGLDRLAL
jgi:hypothetical protein